MTVSGSPGQPRQWTAGLATLAVVAYVPALLSAPGRMPADTKLYLYLDPGGLVRRAASTFEIEQFAGWVPHQQIAYLWPSGPWFWLFDTIGLPDWVAHRLWIGTILFAAGSGVAAVSRRLGLPVVAAVVGGIVYQTSPYLLSYVSRTSLMLLPWAALGWILWWTMRATDSPSPPPSAGTTWMARMRPWREPAAIALIVATIGAVNAAALLLIVPAPALWLISEVWRRALDWRAATAIALRTCALCVLTSAWWIAMVVVQSRHGANVLAFSETLDDVSRNSTGPEVVRSLGYWLFYQRDPVGPTTTASLPYLVSARAIAVSFAAVLVGFGAIAVIDWTGRRFVALLVGVGTVLAVGAHPLADSSPLMALITNDSGSGIALALRSSTRAVPVLLLGLALATSALVAALAESGGRVFTRRTLVAAVIAVLAVANLPSLVQRALVDPAIDRDQDPPEAWHEAATFIDERSDGTRVLQLPGTEFGAFRWGYTADQPLVGLGSTPLVTRDLLPMGSPAAMDLLFAFDDRLQEGTLEPASVAPVGRLFGAGSVLLTNDVAFERYRTARPETVDAALTAPDVAGLGLTTRFGAPLVNRPDVPMIDATSLIDPRIGAPIEPLAVVAVDHPRPIVRAAGGDIIVSGSADGLVDMAAAGLLEDEAVIRYSASLAGDDLDAALSDTGGLFVTDSNRDRARHWRGSQDVVGHTEPGGDDDDVLVATNADQRLRVFESADAATQTVAVQEGPVRATASAYGEPFAYRPEARAAMAVDGDPSTAWTVADHGDPIGERIRLDLREPLAAGGGLRLRQPDVPIGGRWITAVVVRANDSAETFALDERSLGQGQTLWHDGWTGAKAIEIEIAGVAAADTATTAGQAGVGFSEIDLGLGVTEEVVRLPSDAVSSSEAASVDHVTYVFTRLRVDPTDRWRGDPEVHLRRSFVVPDSRRFDARVTLRLDPRASDEAIAALLGPHGPTGSVPFASSRLNGSVVARGAAAADGDVGTSWVTPFDGALGSALTFTVASVPDALELVQPAGDYSPITELTVTDGTSTVQLAIEPADADGRSRVRLPAQLDAGDWSVTISGIAHVTTTDRRYGDTVVLPAAIAELGLDGVGLAGGDPTAVVTMDCVLGLVEIDGRDVPLSFSTTVAELIAGDPIEAAVCGSVGDLAAGEHRLTAVHDPRAALTVDRVVLSPSTTPPEARRVDVDVVRDDTQHRTVTVGACPLGCWLVLGEGYNDAWTASTTDGADLGPPQLVDGGFNGWWIAPTTSPTQVDLVWTAQGAVTWSLTVSIIAFCGLAIGMVVTRRRPPPDRAVFASPVLLGLGAPADSEPWRMAVVPAAVLVLTSAVLIGPSWGLAAALLGVIRAFACARVRRRWPQRWYELAGLAGLCFVAVGVVVIEWHRRPYPNAGWTAYFDVFHRPAVFAVLAIAVGASFGSPLASPLRSRR